MKNKALLISFIMVLLPAVAWATPPESLDVSYNQEKGLITVSGRHPTQDRLEHFIRRVRVTINQDEPQTTYLTRQESASEFQATVAVKGNPGDMIKVEVFCSQGGSKDFTLQVPKVAVIQSAPVNHAQQLKELKDKDHEALPIVP